MALSRPLQHHRWRVLRSLGVEIASTMRDNASKILQTVTAANLEADARIGHTSEFMRHELYLITSLCDQASFSAEELEDYRKVLVDNDDIIIDDDGTVHGLDETEILFKHLFKLVKSTKNDHGTSLMISASILGNVNPSFCDQFKAIIEEHGGSIKECSIIDFIRSYHFYYHLRPMDISAFKGTSALHSVLE